jgi:hypothetical protein
MISDHLTEILLALIPYMRVAVMVAPVMARIDD